MVWLVGLGSPFGGLDSERIPENSMDFSGSCKGWDR